MENNTILLKGDMVKFVAPEIFSSAIRRYVSPGIVVGVEHGESLFCGGEPSNRAKIYWANGRVTNEHFCYLEKISAHTAD